MKAITDFAHFDALDIRVGTIVNVEESKTKKPTWRMTIDFGAEIGRKVSCGAYKNYAAERLLQQQVVCVNFGIRKMGPENSEVLVLGVADTDGQTVPLTTGKRVADGETVF